MARVSFSYAMKRVAPPWLQRTVGGKLLVAVGNRIDELVDRTRDGVALRFPGQDADALPYIGRERRIRRGPGEAAATYAGRLRGWWDAHRNRGGPYALLEQLYAFFLDTLNVQMDVVYHSGTRRWVDAAGTVTRDAVTWGADGSSLWAQIWVFFYLGADPTGIVTASTASDDDAEMFRAIPREWSAAHLKTVTLVLLYGIARCWNYPQPVPTWAVWGTQTTWGGDVPVILPIEFGA